MPRNDETTTKFKVDISELKKAMQDAKREVAVANSEFKAVASTMDDWSKSSDGLEAKLTQLNSNLKSNETILESLEKQYELTVAEMGEGSKAADDLKIKVNNQKAVVNSIEKEISNYEQALSDLKTETALVEVNTDNASYAIKDMGKEADGAEDGFTVLKGAVADFAGSAIALLITGLKDAIGYLGSFGTEAEKAMNGFAAETGATADEMAEFKDTMVDIYNNNFGESFDDIANAMAEVKKQAGDIGADELESMTTNALMLRDTFDFEVTESMRAVKMLMDQFGLSSEEAFNLIAQGAQNGLDKNGDLLDSINEYSVHYSSAGYSAEDFFNSLKNGTAAGTFSVDKLGDAMKEFGIRTKDTATTTTDAFKALGYGAAASQKDIDKTRDKIKSLEEKLIEATETQEELNKKSEELSKTNVQKHEQKISSLTDTIENLEKQLKYAKIEQSNFNDKTSELTRIKNADKIAEYSKKLEEAKAQLSELTTGQTNFTDASTEAAKIKNAEKIAEYTAEIEALKGTLSGMESSTEGAFGSIAELQSRFAAGGDEARTATEEVLKKLFEMENEVERNAVGVGLFGTMWEDLGADGIKALMDMSGEITLTNDALAQINSVKYNTVGEALAGIKRNLETSILLPLSDKILPKVNELVGRFEEWLNNPETQAGIQNLTDALVDFVEGALQDVTKAINWFLDNKDTVISALSGIVAGFLAFKTISFIQSIPAMLGKLKTAVMAVNVALKANPVGVVITAITALVAAFMYLWNNCEGFREFWINLWENLKSAFTTAWDGIVNFFTVTIPEVFTNVINWIKENWQSILLFLINPFAGLFKYFYENNTKFKEFVDTAIAFIKELPAKVWEWLLATINNVAQWGSDLLAKAIETGKNFLDNVVQFFNELPFLLGYALGQAIGQVIKWGIDLYTFATTKVPEFIDKVIEFFKTLPEKVWTWLVNTMTKIKTWGTNVINSAKETGKKFIDNVISFVKGLPAKVWDWLVNTMTKIKTWGTNVINSAKETGKKFIDNVVNFVKQLPSKVHTWLISTLNKVSSWAGDLARKGKEAASNLFNNIVDTIKSLPEKLKSIGSDIVEGLWNGISNMSSWISSKISSFGDGVLSGIKDFFGINSPSKVMADEVGKWIPEGIAVGIEKNAKSALDSMKDLTVNSVNSARNGLAGGVSTAGSSVVNNFYQTNNSPKALSRLEIYRQSKNLLSYAGGV